MGVVSKLNITEPVVIIKKYEGEYIQDVSEDDFEFKSDICEFFLEVTEDKYSESFFYHVEWKDEPINIDLATEKVIEKFKINTQIL